jgi:hypothetical protein
MQAQEVARVQAKKKRHTTSQEDIDYRCRAESRLVSMRKKSCTGQCVQALVSLIEELAQDPARKGGTSSWRKPSFGRRTRLDAKEEAARRAEELGNYSRSSGKANSS